MEGNVKVIKVQMAIRHEQENDDFPKKTEYCFLPKAVRNEEQFKNGCKS